MDKCPRKTLYSYFLYVSITESLLLPYQCEVSLQKAQEVHVSTKPSPWRKAITFTTTMGCALQEHHNFYENESECKSHHDFKFTKWQLEKALDTFVIQPLPLSLTAVETIIARIWVPRSLLLAKLTVFPITIQHKSLAALKLP